MNASPSGVDRNLLGKILENLFEYLIFRDVVSILLLFQLWINLAPKRSHPTWTTFLNAT